MADRWFNTPESAGSTPAAATRSWYNWRLHTPLKRGDLGSNPGERTSESEQDALRGTVTLCEALTHFNLGVAKLASRVLREHEIAGSNPAAQTTSERSEVGIAPALGAGDRGFNSHRSDCGIA